VSDFLTLGSAPAEEECAQVGRPGYREQAIAECRAHVRALRNVLGQEPDGAQLSYRGFSHDFGTYYEVICLFDPNIPEAIDYAFRCESKGPRTWEEGGVAPPITTKGKGRARG